MPRKDKTGPNSSGSMTGRGMGCCSGATVKSYGAGFGHRRHYSECCTTEPYSDELKRELMEQEKDFLQNRLEIITKELDNISNKDESV
jgi:hypothetical protein